MNPRRPLLPAGAQENSPSFFQTDFRALDRDLSPEQMQEWNSIYASYRSKSILTGTVVGVDDNRFEVTNPRTGRLERRTVRSLVIILKEYSSREGKLSISVRDTTPNPFIGAENRHPIGSRRQAVVSGKYASGVFCRLPDDVTGLCLYSNLLGDNEFFPGDSVLIHITQYDYNRQLIYGRIISKW